MSATVSQYGWATAEGWEAHREIITNLYFYQVSQYSKPLASRVSDRRIEKMPGLPRADILLTSKV